MIKTKFTTIEKEFIFGIGATMGLRQFALMMVYPFISIYGMQFNYSTAALVGLALGIFGLVQAFLQVPFGHISDKIGRKKVFAVGIIMLILGLITAYYAKNIYILILARAIQGAGAIQSVAYAWVADSISNEKRNKAMGIIATVVSMSIVVGMIGGPALLKIMSVPHMFLICAILNLFVLVYIMLFLKTGSHKELTKSSENIIKMAVSDKNFILMNYAGLILNYTVVSIFFIVPQFLNQLIKIESSWKVLAPATLIGIIAMHYAVKIAVERYFKLSLISAFTLILFGGIIVYINNIYFIAAGMSVFMVGFMFLATILPSMVTALSNINIRGTMTGIYNSFQYIGTFIGGLVTGSLWGINEKLPLAAFVLLSILGIALMFRVRDK